MREIYFDNSATTRVCDTALASACHAMREVYGNPSSLHQKGLAAEKLLRQAKEAASRSLGVSPEEIIFTSGGTESNNLAILGLARAYAKKGGHIVTSAIEHPSVLQTVRFLQENGYEVTILPVDEAGKLTADEVLAAVREDTFLVSLMQVNNEVGSCLPVAEVGKRLQRLPKKIYLHVDGVQGYGKLPFSPKQAGVDLYSASGHKLHAPKGIGLLYKSSAIRLCPLVHGGGQEDNLRSGTENMPGLTAFAAALDIACAKREEHWQQVAEVRQTFLTVLTEKLAGWRLLSPPDALPYIINITFPGIKSEVLLHALADVGVYASSGAACSSHKKALSSVLMAMGVARQDIEGALRFSFCPDNTPEEAAVAANLVAETAAELWQIMGRPNDKQQGRC